MPSVARYAVTSADRSRCAALQEFLLLPCHTCFRPSLRTRTRGSRSAAWRPRDPCPKYRGHGHGSGIRAPRGARARSSLCAAQRQPSPAYFRRSVAARGAHAYDTVETFQHFVAFDRQAATAVASTESCSKRSGMQPRPRRGNRTIARCNVASADGRPEPRTTRPWSSTATIVARSSSPLSTPLVVIARVSGSLRTRR